MVIERTQDEILIRIPANIDVDSLQALLNNLRLKDISSKSKAKQEEIDEISKAINSKWWNENKKRLAL